MLGLCAVVSAAGAQPATGSVVGRVLTIDGRPVANVEVLAPAASGNVRTDSTGAFRLSGLAAGMRVIQARQIGFQPVRRLIRVGPDSLTHADIVFDVTARRMATISVIAERIGDADAPGLQDFYDRLRRGVGTFITGPEIERAGTLGAVVARVPGVRVERSAFGDLSLSFGRCLPSMVRYYVDGQLTNASGFAFVHPKEIAAMEIYRGPSQLPPGAVGDACAAVYVWTRRS